ncbi:MAG: MarR family transcriptional regulator [Chloroflexota bacterium]|nr:MarR family transcriptional regulator [Chloroflexota bacterium]
MNDMGTSYQPGLVQLLISAGRTMTTLLDERLQPLELSAAKFFTLYILAEAQQEMAFSVLAQALGTGKSNVTPLIDRLEKDGMVRRIRSEDDRRVIYIRITAQGTERLQQAQAAFTDITDSLKGEFTLDEMNVLSGLLARFVTRYCYPD